MLRLAVSLFALAVLAASAAAAATPDPFLAVYAVTYRGLDAGRLRFELRSEEPDLFIYETHPEPSLLARFVVGSEARERSVMRIDTGGVRPLAWFVEDGKAGRGRDGDLTFDWKEERVSGTMKGQIVELPTEPGLQDRLSIQVAVMTSLLRGDEPGIIPMISDSDEIKRYDYTRAGSESVRTPAGEFATVLYESTRPGSRRLSRIWHAPTLGYIPVRAEQLRDGKVETVLQLLEVRR